MGEPLSINASPNPNSFGPKELYLHLSVVSRYLSDTALVNEEAELELIDSLEWVDDDTLKIIETDPRISVARDELAKRREVGDGEQYMKRCRLTEWLVALETRVYQIENSNQVA